MAEPSNPFVKPLPLVTPTTKPYWDGLNEGVVKLQYCGVCNCYIFYPRSHCPRCLNQQLDWREVSGEGTLHTFTVTSQPTAPHFADEVPQMLAMVDLDVGVRMTSTLKNVEPENIKVGMRVKPFFDPLSEDITLLRFQPA